MRHVRCVMRKQKSEFLSALGLFFEIWRLIVDAVKARGGGDDQFRRLATPEGRGVVEQIADLIIAGKRAASQKFCADRTFFGKTDVKVAYRGDQFTAWFKEKVETNPRTGELTAFNLPRVMTDAELIAHLGGEARAEVSLAEVWQLVERQKNGEEGVLLTNGWANLFYVEDANGVLRVVDVYWLDDGWCFNADALYGFRWSDARRAFSRNS